MRKIVDVIALERELKSRIDILNGDNVFMNTNCTNANQKFFFLCNVT